MSNFTDLFPDGGKVLSPTLQTNFFSSRTWVAPQNGVVVIRAMGAGGGGARKYLSNATGGYSGAWGAKALYLIKGTEVVVNIGAGGASAPGHGNGTAGGNTTFTVNGVTYTAFGGPGGICDGASTPVNGPNPSSNFDFGAASVRPGWNATGLTGGAGVDILAQGSNATKSADTNGSGGGGTGSPSTDFNGGGASGSASSLGQTVAASPSYFDASMGEWGISFYGGSGGLGSSSTSGYLGGNGGGGGGSASSSGGDGGNGGGGGAGAYGGWGGYGGGGGGSSTNTAGKGGNGFVHLKFFADMGL